MTGIYSFSIYNYSSETKNIALFPAHFAHTGYKVTQSGTSPFAVSSIEANKAAAAEINKYGFSFDAVLDDGIFLTNMFASADVPTKKIRHFLENIKRNPIQMLEIGIKSTTLPLE